MDACWYGDLLHRDVFGTVVEKLGESSIRSTMRRKPRKGVNVIRKSQFMITKNGRAARCRNDFPFLLKSYSIQTLSWCSHCDPSDALEKRTWRRALGNENKV